MRRIETINKYKEGETTHSIKNPSLDLVIRRYVDKIYYCRDPGDTTKKDFVFFERELMASA